MASTDGLLERIAEILDEQATRVRASMEASDKPLSSWEMKSLTDAMHALVAVKKATKDEEADPELVSLYRLAQYMGERRLKAEEVIVILKHKLEDDERAARS